MTRLDRKPTGTKLLDKFPASPRAQSRMRVVLQTLTGEKTIPDACAELGIREAMFHRIRDQAQKAALDALEAKPMGRPRTATTAQSSRVTELEKETKDLKIALHAAELRAEIAQSMPHLLNRKSRGEKKETPPDLRKDLEAVQTRSANLISCRTARRHGERRHFAVLSRCAGSDSALRRSKTRRGPLAQQSRRALEGAVRVRAVAIGRWAHGRGLRWIEVAASMGLSPRMLTEWRCRWTSDRLQPRPRGRRSVRSSCEQRNAVLRFINDRGPCVGLPALRASFPDLRRCELADRLARYRTVCRRHWRQSLCRLTWLRVGTVWAMDFVEAPQLIDGRYRFLLSAEDLASRYTLLWCPVNADDAAAVIAQLTHLFSQHGAPWVLKCDNGSAFLAEAMKAFLTRWLVAARYSPPRRPQYNGACERNNGCLKAQTHHAAALAAHADWWSSQDTDTARATLNRTVRPWGHTGPTPDDRWRTREPLGEAARTSFRTLLATNQREVRQEMNHPLEVVPDHYPQAAADRIATQRALVTQGLLKVSRRLITLPLKQLKLAKIL